MLSLAAVVATAVAFLLVYLVICTVRQYSALKDFSGPRVAGFTRLWLLRANSSGEMNKAFTHINDQYGKHCVNYAYDGSATHLSTSCLYSIQNNRDFTDGGNYDLI